MPVMRMWSFENLNNMATTKRGKGNNHIDLSNGDIKIICSNTFQKEMMLNVDFIERE